MEFSYTKQLLAAETHDGKARITRARHQHERVLHDVVSHTFRKEALQSKRNAQGTCSAAPSIAATKIIRERSADGNKHDLAPDEG